ncbi:MAG: hypothetical protein MK102_15045 [Fuerstiella sp.]|nr:hypothetical protein [Fuerstiella sp.]
MDTVPVFSGIKGNIKNDWLHRSHRGLQKICYRLGSNFLRWEGHDRKEKIVSFAEEGDSKEEAGRSQQRHKEEIGNETTCQKDDGKKKRFEKICQKENSCQTIGCREVCLGRQICINPKTEESIYKKETALVVLKRCVAASGSFTA